MRPLFVVREMRCSVHAASGFSPLSTPLCGVNVKLTIGFAVLLRPSSVWALQAADLSPGVERRLQVAKNSLVIVRGGVGNARAARKRPVDPAEGACAFRFFLVVVLPFFLPLFSRTHPRASILRQPRHSCACAMHTKPPICGDPADRSFPCTLLSNIRRAANRSSPFPAR